MILHKFILKSTLLLSMMFLSLQADETEKNSIVGFGIGVFGTQMFFHVDNVDVGLSGLLGITEEGEVVGGNVYVNMFLNHNDYGLYVPLSLGYGVFYDNSTEVSSSATYGTGLGYRVGEDIMYIDMSLKVLYPYAISPQLMVGVKF